MAVDLPEGCIANVVSLTSPQEACRVSMVGSTFRSAAESDAVWEKFLPRDYDDIVARAVAPPPRFDSKKQLYLWLSDHPLIIDNATKSFWLEKRSGRRCYMLAARNLAIVWGDTPSYWRWTSLPESRFPEVAELVSVCWLEIRGKINTSVLSPSTTYAAYLVFKSTASTYGFQYQPAVVSVGISGAESETRNVFLDPEGGQRMRYQIMPRRIRIFNRTLASNMFRSHACISRESEHQYPKVRGDGWMEIELGEYFNKGGEDSEMEMSLMEVNGGDWKSGLVVQGIEIRPKEAT
ncbi:F-box protein [Actinidia chinensis var. chinensis]|uniref:F-box protein n=1 Tax=Actinidia chinensis var. chinensis TaxID=1590841 RepID=A0A2R6PYN2_ACTCC|nr:F-box protein [Actinidia chinensis var. chinensis]